METILAFGIRSPIHYLQLVLQGNLHLRFALLYTEYAIERFGTYSLFRETVNEEIHTEKPVIILVGFRLKWINNSRIFHRLFQSICILTTPFWSGFYGFHIKLWMVDPRTNNYMGVYEWYGKENAQTYITTLSRVLQPLSTPHSVSSLIIENESFNNYLNKRKVSPGKKYIPSYLASNPSS